MTANDNLLQPLSGDKERSRLLKLIKYNFWMLITNNCLSMSHIDKVLKYAMGEIQVLPSAQELENVQTGDQLIFSIRLLDSLQLKEVFDFLESLMKACKLGPYAESRGPSRDAFLDSPEDDIRIGVTLDDSLSYIDLNLEPLSSSENSSSPDGEARNTPDVNSVICWLYDDQNDKEKIKALAKEREVGADKIVENLQKEYSELYAVCGEKLLEYQDALKFLKNEIENEPGERTNSAEIPIEWKKELAKGEAFKESRNTDGSINQSDNDDENISRTGSIYNSNTKSAFRKLEEPSNKKLCIVDAKIMKNLATIKQLKSNLERVCFVDYRAILVPLLRVYMQEALKRRIEEHSQRISEEASGASLKELLHDDEKDRDKRDFSPKQLQETSKDRKKSSNSKKSKGKKSR
ncbi:uncharacterized protein A4U43_C03F14730 [Asparagus officinalis]|uniref:DUF629 domain-containing protein n=1 Tax=Asparagus officinalis TaxID=4686 RepID=A0A5P1FAN9_ASPOF|nr:uncharacterized protein LOC109833712 [Asparagus officinalis]ONK75232.1 uncharacterized protein A4U43_C03F14730 [Asparagus officinalis]